MYEAGWLRSEAERALGEPLTEDQWHILDDLGCVYDLELSISQSPSAFAVFADRVRDIRKAFGGLSQVRRERQIRVPGMSQRLELREAALAALLAAEARQLGAVQAYRHDALNDRLLQWEHVEAWLAEQSRKADTDSIMLLITSASISPDELHRLIGGIPQEGGGVLVRSSDFPPKAEEQPITLRKIANQLVVRPVIGTDRPHRSKDELVRHYGGKVRTLRCYVPDPDTGGMREVRHMTGTTGVLERLRQLSQDLATTYGWDAADAARFVLTGLPPRITLITEQMLIDEEIPARSRIILTIDPTVVPADVVDYYQEVRKQVLGRRYRKLSNKHLELVRFAASRRGETGEQCKTAWNEWCAKKHPTWKYRHTSNFLRDWRRAQQHLLNPGIPRKKGEKGRRTSRPQRTA